MSDQQQQQQQQQVQISENPFTVESLRHDNAIVYTGKLAKYMFVKKPVISAAWTLGILLLFCAGGFMIPEEKQVVFDNKMDHLNDQFKLLQDHQLEKDRAYQRYYDSKGWFWQCNQICERNYNKYLEKKSKYDQMKAKYDSKENDIRSYVGLFSEYGVEESKQVYWNINKEGHETAKQMSYFDLMFRGFSMAFSGGNDESIYEVILTLVFQILWNFLIMNIINSIRFVWNIVWLVLSYNPNPVEGALFTALALLAMFAWFMVYNYVLFLVGRGTINITLDVAENQALEQGRQQRRDPRYIHQQQQYYQQQQQYYQQQRQHPHQE